jgi:hypothetical protein
MRDPDDEEVVPIPIGNYPTGYGLDGSGFEPVPGFEHLSHDVDFSQHFVDSATIQQNKKPTNLAEGKHPLGRQWRFTNVIP